MNVLVTGGDGQLGMCLRKAAEISCKDIYFFTDVAELDITDRVAVNDMMRERDIDVIINCAAYTNVDKAESDAEMAEKLNAEGVRNLALAAKDRNAVLIHISTDYVFGGAQGNTPRTEDEPVNPTSVYGMTKLRGELAIAESGARALIFRTAWLYSEYGKNFVKTMLDLTATRPELKVVSDQCGSPTYAQDLADAIVEIVENRQWDGNEGIYHFSNEGVCSWYDFAMLIAEMGGHKDCDVMPCHSDEFPSDVARPAYSVLDKTKFKRTFNRRIPFWVDSLRVCIDNLMSE